MVMIWYWNRYATRPFHFLGSIGLLVIVVSFFGGLISLWEFFHGRTCPRLFGRCLHC
jgi:hypothetical protein